MEDAMTNFNLRLVATLASLTLIACGGSDETDGTDGTDADTDSTTACDVTIQSTFPELDAADVYYRTAIEVEFNGDESTTGSIAVTDGAGAEVAGTTTFSEDGETLVFTPDVPLTSETTYNFDVSFSCDNGTAVPFSFTTGITGPSVDAAALVGNVYNVDIFSGRITKPEGIQDVAEGLLAKLDADVYVLVSPTDFDAKANTVGMSGALGTVDGDGNVVQDICTPSIEFPIAADFAENPYFEIVADTVALPEIEGVMLDLTDVALSGAFNPDSQSIVGVSLAGSADIRDIAPLLGSSADEACLLVNTVAGIDCETCPDGQNYCLSVEIKDLAADSVDATLEVVTDKDAAANDAAAKKDASACWGM